MVRPKSKVRRRLSRGVNVVYKGSVVDGGGFGGAGSGDPESGAWGSLFDGGFDDIV